MKYNEAKEKFEIFLSSLTENVCVISGEWGVGKTTLFESVISDTEKIKVISLLGLSEEMLINFMIKEDYSFIDELKVPMLSNFSVSLENEWGKAGLSADLSGVAGAIKTRRKIRDYKKINVFVFDDCESYRNDHNALIRLTQSMVAQGKKVVLVYNDKNAEKNFQRLEEKLKPVTIVLSEPDLTKYKKMLSKISEDSASKFLKNLRIINKIFKVYQDIELNIKGANKKYLLDKMKEHILLIYLNFDKTNVSLLDFLKNQDLSKQFDSLVIFNQSDKAKEKEERDRILNLSTENYLDEKINVWNDLSLLVKCISGEKTMTNLLKSNINKKTKFLFFDRPVNTFMDKILNDPFFEIVPSKILEFKVNINSNKISFGVANRIIVFWELSFITKKNISEIANESFEYMKKYIADESRNFSFENAFRSQISLKEYLSDFLHVHAISSANFLGKNDLIDFGKFVDDKILPALFLVGKNYFLGHQLKITLLDITWYYNNGNWDIFGKSVNETIKEKIIDWIKTDQLLEFILLQNKTLKHEFWPLHHKFNFIKSFTSSWDIKLQKIVCEEMVRIFKKMKIRNVAITKMIGQILDDMKQQITSSK